MTVRKTWTLPEIAKTNGVILDRIVPLRKESAEESVGSTIRMSSQLDPTLIAVAKRPI